MKAAEWIDRLKTVKGWDSDYRVAKELGISRTTISNYRGRQSTLDEDVALLIAKLLDIELIDVLLDQAAERAKTVAARKAFADAITRFGGKVASILLAATIVSAAAPARVQAQSFQPIKTKVPLSVYTSYEAAAACVGAGMTRLTINKQIAAALAPAEPNAAPVACKLFPSARMSLSPRGVPSCL